MKKKYLIVLTIVNKYTSQHLQSFFFSSCFFAAVNNCDVFFLLFPLKIRTRDPIHLSLNDVLCMYDAWEILYICYLNLKQYMIRDVKLVLNTRFLSCSMLNLIPNSELSVINYINVIVLFYSSIIYFKNDKSANPEGSYIYDIIYKSDKMTYVYFYLPSISSSFPCY